MVKPWWMTSHHQNKVCPRSDLGSSPIRTWSQAISGLLYFLLKRKILIYSPFIKRVSITRSIGSILGFNRQFLEVLVLPMFCEGLGDGVLEKLSRRVCQTSSYNLEDKFLSDGTILDGFIEWVGIFDLTVSNFPSNKAFGLPSMAGFPSYFLLESPRIL